MTKYIATQSKNKIVLRNPKNGRVITIHLGKEETEKESEKDGTELLYEDHNR
jgi:hypothetical protein